jgi:uncharacterized membrane protein
MHSLWLILHFIGLAMGVGTGFAMFTLGAATRNLPPPERAAFMLRASALSQVGGIGLLLLIVSGFGLMYARGGPSAALAWGGGMFHAKLTLVGILILLVGSMHVLMARVRRAGGGPLAARVAMLGQLTLLLGIGIVTLAVLAFR